MTDLKDRIRQLMVAVKLTQQEFAEKLKISPASLSSIFNDRTKPTLNHVEAIMSNFSDINLNWLLSGEGEMFVASQAPGSPSQSSPSPHKPAVASDGSLFLDFDDPSPSSNPSPTPQDWQGRQRMPQQGSPRPDYATVASVKLPDKKPRQITEIRIFFDDQTWESFVPKK